METPSMRTLEEIFQLFLDEINSVARQSGISAAVLARSYVPDEPRSIYLGDVASSEELMPDDPEAIALKARLAVWLLKANHNTTRRGYKTLHSAKIGHEKTHGSKEEKAAKWDKYQIKVDELRQSHPRWSWTEVQRHAANHFGVCEKTIFRHTHDPARK